LEKLKEQNSRLSAALPKAPEPAETSTLPPVGPPETETADTQEIQAAESAPKEQKIEKPKKKRGPGKKSEQEHTPDYIQTLPPTLPDPKPSPLDGTLEHRLVGAYISELYGIAVALCTAHGNGSMVSNRLEKIAEKLDL
jgi:hypothetical protein